MAALLDGLSSASFRLAGEQGALAQFGNVLNCAWVLKAYLEADARARTKCYSLSHSRRNQWKGRTAMFWIAGWRGFCAAVDMTASCGNPAGSSFLELPETKECRRKRASAEQPCGELEPCSCRSVRGNSLNPGDRQRVWRNQHYCRNCSQT